MRAIERVLAGFLLAGALVGTVAVARHAAVDPQVTAVHFQAPPPSHLSIGRPVVVPQPAPPRAIVPVATTGVAAAAPVAVQPAAPRELTVTRPIHVTPVAPKAKPTAAPSPSPAPTPPPTRVIASTVTTATTAILVAAPEQSHGRGHAYGHYRFAQDDNGTPIPSSQDDQGSNPGQGHGNGRGHVSGRTFGFESHSDD